MNATEKNDMSETLSLRRDNPVRTWKRVLYENQKYPDNYVDPEHFFSQLRISESPGLVTYLQTFTYASLVTQQLCAVAVFFAYYKYLRLGIWTAEDIAMLNGSLILVGLLLYFLLYDMPSASKRAFFMEKVKVGTLFGVWLLLATPVLQTLTLSFSEDTIHALAIALVALHIACHDYFYVNSSTDNFSGTISMNAAIFTGILLASRLENHSMVMHAVLLAVLTFSLFPVIAKLVKMRSLTAHWILVVAQALTSVGLLSRVDSVLPVVFSVILCLLQCVAPMVFLQMQSFKKAFHGPWEITKSL